jgi:hypothetical protein
VSDAEPQVTLPLAAAQALFRVYETWCNEVGTCDPGDKLVSDGTVLTSVAALLNVDDANAMEDACTAVEPYEADLRRMLAAAPEPS